MNALVKDCLKLVLITFVAGLALGAVYSVTKSPIEKQQNKAQQEAYRAVFPEAEEFEDMENFSAREAADIFASYENPIEDHAGDTLNQVVAARKGGEDMGYIFDITTHKGYGGDIELTVGIDSEGTVTGYSILSISETAGLGMNAQNPEWGSQFAQKTVEEFNVVKDGSGASDDTRIDAISGATITSKAVTGAVNNCLAYFRTIKEGNNNE